MLSRLVPGRTKGCSNALIFAMRPTRADAGEKHAELEGLCYVIVGARFQTADGFRIGDLRSQHDDRALDPCPATLADLAPIGGVPPIDRWHAAERNSLCWPYGVTLQPQTARNSIALSLPLLLPTARSGPRLGVVTSFKSPVASSVLGGADLQYCGGHAHRRYPPLAACSLQRR
jgi:hypothetical protein